MTDTVGTEVGQRERSSLELARLFHGYSRDYVARKLEITAKTVERHEKRMTPLRRFQLQAYADLYGVQLDQVEDMLNGDGVAA